MASVAEKFARNIPPLPQGFECPLLVGEKVLAVEATYIFPTTGIFPDLYEMVIIHAGFPAMKIEKKEFHPWAHSVAMINPGQPHSAKTSGPCSVYNPFFIEPSLINIAAKSMGGKGSVIFYNGIYDLPGEILNLSRLFLSEANSALPGREFSLACLENLLAVAMLRYLPNNQRLDPDLLPRRDQHSIDRVKEFMLEHFQHNLNLEQLARVANYSTYHFIRFFKNATGKTPFEYFMDIKIEKAADMLQNQDMSVTEVCYTCGFTNPSHFTTVFKRKKGITPSQYQKQS